MKLRFVPILLLVLLLSSFVYADLTTQNFAWYDMSNSSTNVIDISGNSNDGTATSGLTFNNDSISKYGDFDGLTGRFDTPVDLSGDITIRLYVKPEDSGNNYNWFGNPSTTNGAFILDRINSNTRTIFFRDGGGVNHAGLYNFNTDDWSSLTIKINNSEDRLYIYDDGVQVVNISISATDTTYNNIQFGTANSGGLYYQGWMTDIALYNRSLDLAEIAVLEALGRGSSPYDETTGIYVPQITEANQIGATLVSSPTYVPIFTGTINVSYKTNISATLTGSVIGNGGTAIANCEINFNNTQVGFTSTSPPNNFYRSLYANTEKIPVDAGTYNLTVNCRRDGVSSFTAQNLKLLVTQFIRYDGMELNSNYYESDTNINSSSYYLVDTLYFNTSDLTLDNKTTRYILFEASFNEEYDSTGTICIKGGGLGINTSDYCRYGGAGTTGSGGAFTIISQAPANFTIPLYIYARSTTSDGYVNLTINAFEEIAHTNEVNQTQINNITLSSTDWQTIVFRNISNEDHISMSTVAKSSMAIKSNSGSAQMQFRFRINSGINETGEIIYRDVSLANQEGIVSIQEEFSDLPIGDYVVYLEGKTSNSDATITGGQLVIYPANNIAFTSNTFNITAVDKWSSAPIYNFSANLNGLITISDGGTGIIEAPVISDDVDVIIIREGHPNKTIENHNVIVPLEAELGDNYVTFLDTVTQDPLVNDSVSVELDNGTTLNLTTNENGTAVFENYGTYYNFTFEGKQGFVTPITFEYTGTETPFNISYNISRGTLNINIYDRETGNLLTNQTNIIIEGLINGSTSNGTYSFVNQTVSDDDYTIVISSDGFFTEQKIISFTNKEVLNVSFYLLTESNPDSASLTIKTINEYQKLIKGATVSLQEYDIISKSYKEISECISNLDGECKFLIELNAKKYIVTATLNSSGTILYGSMENGEIFTPDIASGEEVIFSEIERSIVLTSSEEFVINPLYDLTYSVDADFNNVTNASTVRVDFSTSDGSEITMCVEYFTLIDGVKESITGQTYCLTGSAGTLTPTTPFILNKSKTYIIEIQAGDQVLETIRYNSDSSIEKLLEDSGALPIIVLFSWVFILFVGLASKNMPLFGVLAIVITWAGMALVPSVLMLSISAFKTIISVILIYQARKKEDII